MAVGVTSSIRYDTARQVNCNGIHPLWLEVPIAFHDKWIKINLMQAGLEYGVEMFKR